MFEHAGIPRNVLAFGEANPVQRYCKTIPTCSNCDKVGHRTDVFPNPTTPSSRCPTCRKADVDLANHECLACCLLCNDPHIAGAIRSQALPKPSGHTIPTRIMSTWRRMRTNIHKQQRGPLTLRTTQHLPRPLS
ncbi:hypothetical protein MRX96_016682 [Rhipicephalus microplus]